MGIFSFTKKDKRATAEDVPEADATETRFLLHVATIGWHSGLQLADGTVVEKKHGDAIHAQGEGWKRMEGIIKRAVAENTKTIRRANKISLLVDGLSVQVTDNKQKVLIAASGATARQFGQQWLNVAEVTYGFANLPPYTDATKSKQTPPDLAPIGKERGDGVYAFADAELIRHYLALFDKDSIKVTDAVPIEYVLTYRATRSGEPVYGALQMGGRASKLVLVNHPLGIVLVRRIPVGVLTLIEAVAKKIGVQVQDAAQGMTQKDWVSVVVPATPNDTPTTTASLNKSLHTQALEPHMTRMLDDLQESLAFFAFQKVAGAPKQVELFGAEQVFGLKEWLGRFSGMPMSVSKESLLDLFAKMPSPVGCNLLKGAESNLLTVGRTKFFFVEDKGFVSSQEFAAQKTAGSLAAGARRPTSSGRHDARKTQKRPGGGRPETETSGGWLAALMARLGTTGSQQGGPTLEELDPAKERQYFYLLSALVALLLYWGYSEYETAKKVYLTRAATYLASRERHDQFLQQTLNLESSAQRMGAAAEITKIFWSEKFLALANNMTKHIWLTDVFLSTADRTVAGSNVKSKTMVIEGRVLPSTDGHVQIIAVYVENLLKDTNWFMSDFRDVEFKGAEYQGNSEDLHSDPQIHFTLHALYDKNKRLENKKSEEEQKDVPPLLNMQRNVNDHNKKLENSLDGNTGE